VTRLGSQISDLGACVTDPVPTPVHRWWLSASVCRAGASVGSVCPLESRYESLGSRVQCRCAGVKTNTGYSVIQVLHKSLIPNSPCLELGQLSAYIKYIKYLKSIKVCNHFYCNRQCIINKTIRPPWVFLILQYHDEPWVTGWGRLQWNINYRLYLFFKLLYVLILNIVSTLLL